MADAATQSVSLRDALSKSYDEQATNTKAEETPEVETAQDEPKGRVRDESGRFVRAENEPIDVESKPEKTQTQETENETKVEPEVKHEPGLEAPQHWSAADKELFGKQPKEVQEYLLRRHKDMEADYTRKTQDVADTKRFRENVDQLMNPHRNFFAMNGLDDVGAIRYMLGWFGAIQQDPAQAIHSLAQTYGIDFNPKQEENIDPNVKALRDEVAFLKNTIAQTNQAQQNQVSSNLLEQVNSFRDEKDSTGNLKHPHFEAVRKDMSVLVGSGRAKNMEEAYELAVRLNPEIYDKQKEQSILEQQKAAQQKELDEQKKKAAQAKKAATGIRSGSASVDKQGPRTLKEELSALYDKQAAS
jgi:hypothetical protein